MSHAVQPVERLGACADGSPLLDVSRETPCQGPPDRTMGCAPLGHASHLIRCLSPARRLHPVPRPKSICRGGCTPALNRCPAVGPISAHAVRNVLWQRVCIPPSSRGAHRQHQKHPSQPRLFQTQNATSRTVPGCPECLRHGTPTPDPEGPRPPPLVWKEAARTRDRHGQVKRATALAAHASCSRAANPENALTTGEETEREAMKTRRKSGKQKTHSEPDNEKESFT